MSVMWKKAVELVEQLIQHDTSAMDKLSNRHQVQQVDRIYRTDCTIEIEIDAQK